MLYARAVLCITMPVTVSVKVFIEFGTSKPLEANLSAVIIGVQIPSNFKSERESVENGLACEILSIGSPILLSM